MPDRIIPTPSRQDPPRQGLASGESLFSQVTNRLAVAIVAGELAVGARLPKEEALGLEVTASRTAYREAVRFLAGKGLIEAKPRFGTRVAARSGWHLSDPDVLKWSLLAGPNEEFIRDLFELRMLIEPGCAKFAAMRRSKADLEQILAAAEGMRLSPAYSDENIAHDLAFHRAIFAATGNAALSGLSEVVATTLTWAMRLRDKGPADAFAVPLSDHLRIADAISRQDGDMAEMLMRILVSESLREALFNFHRLELSDARELHGSHELEGERKPSDQSIAAE